MVTRPVLLEHPWLGLPPGHRALATPDGAESTSESTPPRWIPSADFLADRSVATEELVIPTFTSHDRDRRRERPEDRDRQSTSSAPTTARRRTSSHSAGLRRHGWKQIPAGWLVESSRPLKNEQIADARDIAADAGLTIEVQGEGRSLATAKDIATTAGAVLALAILALTVGLIRSESAGDLRTLTATGADSSIRRTLTATTAGVLALLGALLGVAGAYVVLLAMCHLSDVPLSYLAVAVVGVPADRGGCRGAPRRPRATHNR